MNRNAKRFDDYEKDSIDNKRNDNSFKPPDRKNSDPWSNNNDDKGIQQQFGTSSMGLLNNSAPVNPSSSILVPQSNVGSLCPQALPQQFNQQQYTMFLAQLQLMQIMQQQQQVLPLLQQQDGTSGTGKTPVQNTTFENNSQKINLTTSNGSITQKNETSQEDSWWTNGDHAHHENDSKRNDSDQVTEGSRNLGNSYYRDNHSSHGNSSYNQRATSPRSLPSVKRKSKFSFLNSQV